MKWVSKTSTALIKGKTYKFGDEIPVHEVRAERLRHWKKQGVVGEIQYVRTAPARQDEALAKKNHSLAEQNEILRKKVAELGEPRIISSTGAGTTKSAQEVGAGGPNGKKIKTSGRNKK